MKGWIAWLPSSPTSQLSTGSLFAEALKAVICLEMADAGAGLVTCPQRKAEPESKHIESIHNLFAVQILNWHISYDFIGCSRFARIT